MTTFKLRNFSSVFFLITTISINAQSWSKEYLEPGGVYSYKLYGIETSELKSSSNKKETNVSRGFMNTHFSEYNACPFKLGDKIFIYKYEKIHDEYKNLKTIGWCYQNPSDGNFYDYKYGAKHKKIFYEDQKIVKEEYIVDYKNGKIEYFNKWADLGKTKLVPKYSRLSVNVVEKSQDEYIKYLIADINDTIYDDWHFQAPDIFVTQDEIDLNQDFKFNQSFYVGMMREVFLRKYLVKMYKIFPSSFSGDAQKIYESINISNVAPRFTRGQVSIYTGVDFFEPYDNELKSVGSYDKFQINKPSTQDVTFYGKNSNYNDLGRPSTYNGTIFTRKRENIFLAKDEIFELKGLFPWPRNKISSNADVQIMRLNNKLIFSINGDVNYIKEAFNYDHNNLFIELGKRHENASLANYEEKKFINNNRLSPDNETLNKVKALQRSLLKVRVPVNRYGYNLFTMSQVVKSSLSSEDGYSEWKGNGSGFMISKNGHIATNHHVVKDAEELEVEVMISGRLRKYNAIVVNSDPNNDLAIIKIEDPNFQNFRSIPYNFKGRSSDVGTEVFALGYPMALSIMGKEIKFTDGRISSKTGFRGDITSYQTTTPIQPGNSGGPLFDHNANLIGINSSGLSKDIADNVSYTIKTNYLINLIDALPESIPIPSSTWIASKPLTEQIKILSNYVVLIKVK